MKKSVRSLSARVIAASCVAVSLLFAACAEVSAQVSPPAYDSVIVYGKPYRVKVYNEPEGMSWNDVKPFLPDFLKKADPAIKADEQILAAVFVLRRNKSEEYRTAFDAYLQDSNVTDEGERIELATDLGESFAKNRGGSLSPDVQRLSLEFQALDYLYTMLHVAIKGTQPRFGVDDPA